MAEPITTQVDAIVHGIVYGLSITPGWGGRFNVSSNGRRIEARVWERLLELGHLYKVEDARNPNRAPVHELYVTNKGRRAFASYRWKIASEAAAYNRRDYRG